MQTYLTNARLVLADAIIDNGSVLINDGVIQTINPEACNSAKVVDLGGRTLMPGMIDLHCDALEKEVEPRPNVHFPLDYACAQADKRNATAGITTVFHSLSFANEELGVRNNDFAASIARAVHDWNEHALIDNRVHCRYEITDSTGLPVLLDLLDRQDAHLISFMDHTPGQGQFKNLAAYREYITRTYKRSSEEFDAMMESKLAAAEGAAVRIKTLVAKAHEKGIATASHDDDNQDRIETMTGLGVNISEFPVNLETAGIAREKGMYTVFGAPNILRGESQSGSMKAVDAIEANVASCLCADYAPASLVVATFKLVDSGILSLTQAVQLVTKNPAKAAGLNDRGEIAVDKRADLIAVDFPGGLPQVTHAWSGGVAAFASQFHAN